jgi:L-ornithine N5-oxygenase
MSTAAKVYDLIGLGFGPANIAIAGALIDKWDTTVRSSSPTNAVANHIHQTASFRNVCFIEKHDKFRWHPGMLLPGTRMQIRCVA